MTRKFLVGCVLWTCVVKEAYNYYYCLESELFYMKYPRNFFSKPNNLLHLSDLQNETK